MAGVDVEQCESGRTGMVLSYSAEMEMELGGMEGESVGVVDTFLQVRSLLRNHTKNLIGDPYKILDKLWKPYLSLRP
jgi:hypothetical protein